MIIIIIIIIIITKVAQSAEILYKVKKNVTHT